MSVPLGLTVAFRFAARWSSLNSPSSGAAPASFAGFASQTPDNPPQCAEGWTTETANSSTPPATVPPYMAVTVVSEITQSGSTISANALEVVVVKANPGYAPNRVTSARGP